MVAAIENAFRNRDGVLDSTMNKTTSFSIQEGLRISTPTVGLIFGPQNSGKTTLLLLLIRNRTKIFVDGEKITKIFLMYAYRQILYEEMRREFGEMLVLIEGFDENYYERHHIPPHSLFILDDFDN